jgi:hypothetical protein
MYVCERCHEEVDEHAPDVVNVEHWLRLEATFDSPETWVQGPNEFFHKRHVPKLGLEYRMPG